MMTQVDTFALRQPGWEQSRWHHDGHALHFTWTMPDSQGLRPPISVHTEQVVDANDKAAMERAAWFCVRMAVLHEAGERFYAGAERPYHPHKVKWWEREYLQGMEALNRD